MAFGWFGKSKQGGEKALAKAHKLVAQARWAEALTFYEEAAADAALAPEATQGARTCRQQLVTWNLEEALAFQRAGEEDRAHEHAELALQLAGDEEDLAAQARTTLAEVSTSVREQPPIAPQRMFEPSCGAACASCGDQEPETESPGEELFEFYLDSLSPAERQALEPLGLNFQRGFVALQNGELDAARPLLQAAAEEEAGLPGAAYGLALLESVAGDTEAALDQFRRALDLDPELGPAAHHSADLLCELERPQEAEQLLLAWTENHPQDVDAWFLLARCRDRGGDPSGALQALATAEGAAGEFQPRLALARATLLQRTGDDAGALKAYQETTSRNPNLLEALVPMGRLLIDRGGGDAERAAEVFKHCRRIDPERGWWHLLQVARAYAARGWTDRARELLHTARGELPDSPDADQEWQAVADRVEDTGGTVAQTRPVQP